ncbi:unnamed protein product (macronuclear) [Paramecium tetraurelia]|uniref:Uncharacterized protein n=1 Tax=Paramecium tetraurelia TaxID=5888 RepID=A0CSA9_PARTE|nr:uncharacterized protein GSPATT00009948001 [Paramecium tetraurelia]CAK73676.1 unnamed protein product [Paramecium tetraurelia]|eukprot:XP_001441073.1 hypothetical protein (macronuclear) [Paramecium tetraurelia strain d4-2]
MHKFLLENQRINYSSFNPFGSSKNLKPGIITKLKNKISALFQPTINSQSLLQRIQPFEDQKLEQELSNQFKKNLVLVDRIVPNKDYSMALKRKSFISFEQYLKEELNIPKKMPKETQTVLDRKTNDSDLKSQNVKKQRKLYKDHAKIQQDRKMEENQIQPEFNQNIINSMQVSLNEKKGCPTEHLSNTSNKKVKQLDIFAESSIPNKLLKGEISDNQSSMKILETLEIGQNDDNKCQKSEQLLEKLKASSFLALYPSNNECIKDDINVDKNQSSSTGMNSKVEANDTLVSFKNADFQSESQFNLQNIDNNQKLLNFNQDQGQEFQNYQKSNEYDFHQKQLEFNQVNQILIQKDVCISQNNIEQQRKKSENQSIQQSEQSKLIFTQVEGNKGNMQQVKQNLEQRKRSNLTQIDQQDGEQFENVNLSNIQVVTSKQTQLQQKLENQKEKIHTQVLLQGDQLLKKKIQSQYDKQDQIAEKEQKLQNPQNQQCKEIQKNILQSSFLNNQNKQVIEKNEKLNKEYNPFLVISPNISSDQISQYFQGGLTANQNNGCQPQNQNQPIDDLFKITISQSQSIINNTQDKQNPQNLQSMLNVNNFGNARLQTYPQNKSLDIFQLAPQITPIIQQQTYSFESAKLNYQQQQTQQNNLFQQQQQQQQQHYYSEQLMQQSNYQLQNLFSQQHQTSNSVSSLNLFQSNPYQQQQNDSKNQQLYFKNDVLSLFQETKKQDRSDNLINSLDIFQTQQYQQACQSLNNSLNKGRKKQRINNF